MGLVCRIFHKTREACFDVPLHPQATLASQMATFRTDGFAMGDGWYVPYDQISMALVYEMGNTAPVFSLVPKNDPEKPL